MANGRDRTGAVKDDRNAPLGFEAQFWAAADALRSNLNVAEYKHDVLSFFVLKYLSDALDAGGFGCQPESSTCGP